MNFSKLIDLIVSCGGKDLEDFVRMAAKNASYTSTDAITDVVEAIGVWVDELQVYQGHNAPFFSLMAYECVDIANIEELSVYCRWVENEVPVEHFMEICPLKKTDAQSIYSVLLDWLKKKDFQCNKLVGMSFDGAAIFAGKKSGVQAHLKKNAPIQSSPTAHVISFNWLVFNLQTALRESSTCIPHSLHCGNFSQFAKEMSEYEGDTESTNPS